jgi:hypothetical protein
MIPPQSRGLIGGLFVSLCFALALPGSPLSAQSRDTESREKPCRMCFALMRIDDGEVIGDGAIQLVHSDCQPTAAGFALTGLSVEINICQ